MPGVLAIITPDNADEAAAAAKKVPQAVAGAVLQDTTIRYNGQHVAVVVAERWSRRRPPAPRVRVSYTQSEPATSMEAMLAQAYAAEALPQRRSGRRIRNRGDPDARCSTAAR